MSSTTFIKMKLKLVLPLFCIIFLFHTAAFGVHSSQPVGCAPENKSIQHSILPDRLQLESQLGRKLSFSERIALIVLKAKIKKSEKKVQKYNPENPEKITDGFAITGFVMGILSLIIFGIPFGILAIFFSTISLGRIKKFDGLYNGKGLAVAGLVMGIVGLAGAIIILAASL